jgi:hypothetical protein
MILLNSTSDKLRLVTGQAGDIRVHAAYADLASGAVTVGRLNTAISTATTTDIVASPSASTSRAVQLVNIWNDNATDANQITIQHTDGTTTVDLYSISLPAQAGIVYVEGEGWTVTGNSQPTNIQVFSANGTWNKPTSFNAGVVLVRLWGAGGGGGGGSSLATATTTKGGAGGGGGCFVERIFRASDLASSESVTIGAGGAAGTGATAGGSGGDGGVGGNTTFGSLLTGYGGGGGRGGQNSALATGGGGGGGGHSAGTSGNSTNAGVGGTPAVAGPGFDVQGINGTVGAGGSHYGHLGGGGGGGSTNAATPTSNAGGGSLFGGGGGGSGGCTSNVPNIVSATAGGGPSSTLGTGGAAGVSGSSPTVGDAGAPSNGLVGGAGGGGGGSTVQASTAGAAGGAGGLGGGGGGGGGRGSNPGLGGAGGVGGDGYCVVISW